MFDCISQTLNCCKFWCRTRQLWKQRIRITPPGAKALLISLFKPKSQMFQKTKMWLTVQVVQWVTNSHNPLHRLWDMNDKLKAWLDCVQCFEICHCHNRFNRLWDSPFAYEKSTCQTKLLSIHKLLVNYIIEYRNSISCRSSLSSINCSHQSLFCVWNFCTQRGIWAEKVEKVTQWDHLSV